MELYDKLFYWTYLSPNDTGLLAETYVSIHFTNRRPALLVGNYGRDAAVLIDDNPRMLWGYLEDDVKEEIFEWVRVNKKVLLEYWNEEVSTVEIIRDLINMKEIIKREPTDFDVRLLQKVSPDELLTAEDEVELVKQIQRGEGDVDAAKEKLLYANRRFVYSVASRYVSKRFSLDELVAEGNLGLEHAIYRYDETRGFKFICYAVWWIRQSIQQAIVQKDR